MWTCKAFDPKRNKVCDTRNPDDVGICASCGAARPKKQVKPVGFLWVVVVPVVALVICMFLPLILSLALRLDFNASLERAQAGDTGGGVIATLGGGKEDIGKTESGDLLPGAISQSRKTTLTSEYKAIFVPSNLTKFKGSMVAVQIFYGPLLITGAPLDLTVSQVNQGEGLHGGVNMRLASWFVPIIVAIAFFFFFVIVDNALGDPRSLLKFLIGFTIVWLVYSYLMYLLVGPITSGVQPFFNELLTMEQRPASFSPVYLSAPLAAGRVFLIGMFYWVLSFLFRKARKGGIGSDAMEPRPGRATVS
jgi:hypothetical protein